MQVGVGKQRLTTALRIPSRCPELQVFENACFRNARSARAAAIGNIPSKLPISRSWDAVEVGLQVRITTRLSGLSSLSTCRRHPYTPVPAGTRSCAEQCPLKDGLDHKTYGSLYHRSRIAGIPEVAFHDSQLIYVLPAIGAR